jgi:prevent-host-death family protein
MKRLTMSEFRKEPGDHLSDVRRRRESFLLTKDGKPVARIVPVDEITVIQSDGTILGEKPLTLKLRLADDY